MGILDLLLPPPSVEESNALWERRAKDQKTADIVGKVRGVEELTSELNKAGVQKPTMDYLRQSGMVEDKRYSYGKVRRSATNILLNTGE